jgi:hypothetical protein
MIRGILCLAVVFLAAMSGSVSSVVAQVDIIFSHKLHVVDNDVECLACHETVKTSALADDKNFPSMDVCAQCHEQVSNDDACKTCHHKADEPQGIEMPRRGIVFSHQSHLNRKADCLTCHVGIDQHTTPDPFAVPSMGTCMNCHDGTTAPNKCSLCHESKVTLADIHPSNWRFQHADKAANRPEWCQTCHQNQNSCLACHRGDNLTGKIHDLNYQYTHGLDAKSKRLNCQACHDTRAFCDDCHQSQGRMPLEHSTIGWISRHGEAARRDLEGCASCHDQSDPTCARAGCHRDADGVRGTDPSLHGNRTEELKYHGPWHSDDGYVCFQCHVSTHSAGQGFCGYCHGRND